MTEKSDNSKGDVNIGSVGGNYYAGDYAGRDMYKNISNSTITKVENEHGREVGAALKQAAEITENSNNDEANRKFKEFSDELSQPKPDKSRLQRVWSTLEQILPAVAQISGKIAPLFMAAYAYIMQYLLDAALSGPDIPLAL
jgi:hypothetical protein